MMSCAELLAVCLLSADRGPKPHRQPLPIFHDVSTAGGTPAPLPSPGAAVLPLGEPRHVWASG